MSECFLWLIRHAKARRHGINDHARELSKRGIRQCQEIKEKLKESYHLPTLVLTSSASRAKATAHGLFSGSASTTILESDTLYTFDSFSLVHAIQESLNERSMVGIKSVAVVGHNSAISHCVTTFTQGKYSVNLPTLGIAGLKFKGDWSEIGSQEAELWRQLAPTSDS